MNHSVRFKSSLDQTLDLPYALLKGEEVSELPRDLFIPPEAMEVVLEQFEGPLDLLLYLIRKQNLDVLEVNITEITHQYIAYIDMMKAFQLELAAEYLVMAATLAEIKSRMLLPRQRHDAEEVEEDPRAELIRRLLEYERFKEAAETLDQQPRLNRDIFIAKSQSGKKNAALPCPDVSLSELSLAYAAVLKRSELYEEHEVTREQLSTQAKMSEVLLALKHQDFVPFVRLIKSGEGRLGIVVTFLALLELVKEQLIDLVQAEPFAGIHVKAR